MGLALFSLFRQFTSPTDPSSSSKANVSLISVFLNEISLYLSSFSVILEPLKMTDCLSVSEV